MYPAADYSVFRHPVSELENLKFSPIWVHFLRTISGLVLDQTEFSDLSRMFCIRNYTKTFAWRADWRTSANYLWVTGACTVVSPVVFRRWPFSRSRCAVAAQFGGSEDTWIRATGDGSGAMQLSLPDWLTCWYYFCYAIPCRYIVRELARKMDYQCIIVYTVITILPPRYEIEDVSSRNSCFSCIKKAIKRSV